MSPLLLSASHLAVNIQLMPALRDLNVQIREGEMVGLMGRNGAGKTTFMRTVMGHLPPASGDIAFLGENLDNCPDGSRRYKFPYGAIRLFKRRAGHFMEANLQPNGCFN